MYTTEENKVTCLISFIYMTNYQNDLKICAGIKKKYTVMGKWVYNMFQSQWDTFHNDLIEYYLYHCLIW